MYVVEHSAKAKQQTLWANPNMSNTAQTRGDGRDCSGDKVALTDKKRVLNLGERWVIEHTKRTGQVPVSTICAKRRR